MTKDALFTICFISPTVYPLFNTQERACYGDAEIQLYELAAYFGREKDFDVSVITGDYGQDDVEFYSGVLVYKCDFGDEPGFFQKFFSKPSPLTQTMKQINAQCYLMTGPNGREKEASDYCAKQKRTFIYRVTSQQECDGSYVRGGGEKGERFLSALKKARFVVCQTQEQKRLLRRREKIDAELIPNGVYLKNLSSEKRHDTIWIGPATAQKQPEYFLRLALSAPNLFFTLFITPDKEDYLEKLIENTRDIPNLGVHNSMPYHEITALIESAKLLVNTSRHEGFPYFFSLAFAAGVPVVSLNIDPDGVLENEQIGVCAGGSEVRMVQSVRDLTAYDRQWKRMSQNAFRFAQEKQNFHEIAKEYCRLFAEADGASKKRKKKKSG